MNASCPHCNTVFRVDPRKVPAGGVRARCSICRGVFAIGDERRDAEPAPVAASPAPALAPAAAEAALAPAVRPAAQEMVSAPAPAAPSAPVSAPAPAAAPAASPEPAPARPAAPSPFGASDPHSKARRLARALVSDIVTYHPGRRDTALQNGTLKREFLEEIKKSWEEYVGQVGQEMAHGTPYFREALNDILARGQKVF